MSQISKYQEGIKKFIKENSVKYKVLDENLETHQKIIEKINFTSDFLPSIISLTVMNGRCKEINEESKDSRAVFHGYHLASGIDICLLIAIICDKHYLVMKNIDAEQVSSYLLDLHSLVMNSYSSNFNDIVKSMGKRKMPELIEVAQFCQTYISSKMREITKISINEKTCAGCLKIKKTDFVTFGNFGNDEKKLLDKYKSLQYLSESSIEDLIYSKYGAVCQIAFVCAWMLGLGNQNYVKDLEEVGLSLGFMIKTMIDFEDIIADLTECKTFSTNVVINFGIKNIYEKFFEHKTKMIEILTKLDLYNKTIRGVVDWIDERVENCLEKTKIDEKFSYSSTY